MDNNKTNMFGCMKDRWLYRPHCRNNHWFNDTELEKRNATVQIADYLISFLCTLAFYYCGYVATNYQHNTVSLW